MIRVTTSEERAGAPGPARARGLQSMTLSNGQALAGAHIPTLVPLRETAKLPPNASTLRAIRRASITGTFVTAKSGDKAAFWFRLASEARPAVACGPRPWSSS